MDRSNKPWVNSRAVDTGSREVSSEESSSRRGFANYPSAGPEGMAKEDRTWTGKSSKRTNSFPTLIPTVSSHWEHELTEKHLQGVPPVSQTTRFFDRARQTRRVFIDCFFMWLPTACICAFLAGTMYGFSTITGGLTDLQKSVYNSLITGLSLLLGLAFAAQFKQYCEVMRWRFLAAKYRSLEEFEHVIGCDSYRSTMRLILGPRTQGKWYPSKSQLVAAFWFFIFLLFNVAAALLGLTYSIDVSETQVFVSHGPMSVTDLRYIASYEQPDGGVNYPLDNQLPAANLWGAVGQNYGFVDDKPIDDPNPQASFSTVYTTPSHDQWWYRFLDTPAGSGGGGEVSIVSTRVVTTTATCQELEVLMGGYAGFNYPNDPAMGKLLTYVDETGTPQNISIESSATGKTTWLAYTDPDCGPRCTQVYALQNALNDTTSPTPRFWHCNNTVSEVLGIEFGEFDNATELEMSDDIARIIAGAVGWSGVNLCIDADNCVDYQQVLYSGDSILSPASAGATPELIAETIMTFTAGVVAAMDLSGPRRNVTGAYSPSPAQVVNVKWTYAGAILGGIPGLQFLMLLGVVWFSRKSIILEPSFITAAHLMRPILDKLGPEGCLLSVDEMSERLGDFKVAYGVRPHPDDPGHHDKTFTRHVGLLKESEGYGYIRGKMPESRYD